MEVENHTQPIDIVDFIEDLHYALLEEDERDNIDILKEDGIPVLYITGAKVPIMFHGIISEKWINSEEIFDYFMRTKFVLKVAIEHFIKDGDLSASRIGIVRDNERYYVVASDLKLSNHYDPLAVKMLFAFNLNEDYWKEIDGELCISATGLHHILNAGKYFSDSPKSPKRKFKTYLIKETASNLIKIGRSRDPESRLSQFKTSNPNCKLIAVCDNDIETDLHKKYDKQRYKGEWFDLSKSDVEYIISGYGFKKYRPDSNLN